VTAYVFTIVPLLLFLFGLMVINAPRIITTAYDSFFVQYHKVQHAFDGGSAMTGVIGIVQMLILLLPALGIVATFWMAFKRTGRAVWSRTENPAARGGFVLASSALAAFLAYIWWPNGDYRPIQPGERGTIGGAIEQLAAVQTGRPALTKERERELGGAPLLSSNETTSQEPTRVSRTPTTSTPTQTIETPTVTTTGTTTTSTETTSTTTATTTP
jgi:putative peptide zinc metalloprotease protein